MTSNDTERIEFSCDPLMAKQLTLQEAFFTSTSRQSTSEADSSTQELTFQEESGLTSRQSTSEADSPPQQLTFQEEFGSTSRESTSEADSSPKRTRVSSPLLESQNEDVTPPCTSSGQHAAALLVTNDFCQYVNAEALTPSQRLMALHNSFQPEESYKFPTQVEYGKQRSFQFSWLKEHNWLAYSPSHNGAYCKICVLFGQESSSDKNASKLNKLVKTPITFWTTCSSKLKEHETKSQVHKTATLKANNFLQVMQSMTVSVGQQLETALARQVDANRRTLHSLVRTVLFCGRQNIPLRGHRETDTTANPGNFKALLNFRVESGDQTLKNHFLNAPRNAVYTSKTIQNELIAVIGHWIQKKLMQDLQEGSRIFSILADESADCSNQEQMALIIRYVNAHKEIQEMFLTFIECEEGTTGMHLATVIKSACQTLHLDLSLCRGQGYDGAGNMSGKTKGAAAIIQSEFPKALYFHCASHKLNLCIVHSCKVISVTNMMDAITCLANFFNFSPQRQKGLEYHLRNYPDTEKAKLLPLCTTRWVERLDALEVTLDLMEGIIDTLADMVQHTYKQWNKETTTQAFALLKRLDFEFLVNLIVTQKVLAFTSGVTSRLQKRGIDVVEAYQYVQHVIRTLQNVRGQIDSYFHDWFEEVSDLARKLNIEVKMPRVCGRQTHRHNAMAIRTESVDERSVEVHFRINVAIPFVEAVVGELQARFEDCQLSAVKGTMLLPSAIINNPTCWQHAIKPFLDKYASELPSQHTLDAELVLWSQLWADKWDEHWKALEEQHLKATGQNLTVAPEEEKILKTTAVPNTIASTLMVTNPDIFPNICHLLSILAVLPATTCEVERCFSSLRRLKTYLRSTMGGERLTGLALMHVHQHISVENHIDEIINDFAIMHPRRMKLANIIED